MTFGSALKRLNSNDAWTLQDYALRALAKRGLDYLDPEMQAYLKRNPFLFAALDTQVPPQGPWRTWLFMGGRGAGKTRAGAEWVRMAVRAGCRRVALVGPALSDVREVMIEGPSGLRHLEGAGGTPVYEVSRRRLVWPNGAEGFAFSAEDPDSLRGPQFDAAWCDELGAWAKGEAVWDNLQMGLRLGPGPRCVATTTPRPVDLVRRLVVAPDSVMTRSATRENAVNLSPGFVTAMEAAYGHSSLARQELMGELIADPEGALFVRSKIDQSRVFAAPAMADIVVAVDPPATSGPRADACGIVAAGIAEADGFGRRCFVLGDASAPGLRPHDWASRAVALAEAVGASMIIAEANQGGEMVRQTLMSAGCRLPVRLVHARLGKRARALPVALLYEQGKVAHVGLLATLEDQMCRFGAEGFTGSPDRVDALVWAVWALMLERGEGPRIRPL